MYKKFVDFWGEVHSTLLQGSRGSPCAYSKNVKFHWVEDCQKAFEALKRKLVFLAYPSFPKDFVLEADASIEGLGEMPQDGY